MKKEYINPVFDRIMFNSPDKITSSEMRCANASEDYKRSHPSVTTHNKKAEP